MGKKKIDHGSRAHALVSASGASRWMNCTPSPRLEEHVKERTSIYAAEGTLAHEFAELNLKIQLGMISKEEYDDLVEPLLKDKWYSEEMEEHVQKHVDYVTEQFKEANRITKGAAVLSIEEKIDLTDYIEDGFGSNDVVIIADKTLEVVDYKHGKGVRVDAKDNPQLKLYGLGALREAELMYDIEQVRLTITQPRMDSISTWTLSVEELKNWGEEVVKPKAKMAYAGEGKQVPGDWCRFCKVKARCKALAKENLEVAKVEFSDPRLLSDEELIEAYKKMPQISKWIKSVSDYLLVEALEGKKWPGHKLVEGRSSRKWSDPVKAIEILKKKRFKRDQYLSTPKLLGIGAIEKLVTKKKFFEVMGSVVEKSAGSPTLVSEEDKREEWSSVQSDFGESIETLS